jgi:hypothetical protein
MLKCPVCGTENNDLDTVCRSCKGFIQAKVDTLDLFSTCWGLVENPDQTFRRIALSRSKNYVVVLSALTGVALVYTYIWYWQLAVQMPSLPVLLGIGALIGLVLGNALTTILALVSGAVLRLGGAALSLRNCKAIIAYAGMPVIVSLFVVFPVEIAVFGRYLFDKNPSPMVINAPIYVALLGLDALAVLWSLALLVVGLRSAIRGSWFWSILVALIVGGSLALLIICFRLD